MRNKNNFIDYVWTFWQTGNIVSDRWLDQVMYRTYVHFWKLYWCYFCTIIIIYLFFLPVHFLGIKMCIMYMMISMNCICSAQARYSDLVMQLLTAQTNSPYYHRLLEAFNSLTTPGQQLTIDRANRIRFQQNFDRFLIEVRSFLCVR